MDQGGLTLTTRDQYINKTVEEDPVLGALLQVMTTTSLLLYKEKRNLTSVTEIPALIQVLHCIVLQCTVLYCIVYCTALYCSVLQADISRQMREIIELERELANVTIPATQQRDGEDRSHVYFYLLFVNI